MEKLTENWITDKLIDFEYKKYLLLAYLQKVSDNFDAKKLYPFLADLVMHYRNTLSIKESKEAVYNSFPTTLKGADLEKFKLIYDKMVEDDGMMSEIEQIIEFSIPQFERYLTEGKQIYDLIESRVNISPVGIMPLKSDEGYMILEDGSKDGTKVFEYQITIFNNANDKYRGIHTQYLVSYKRSIANTYESLKTDLIRSYKKFPNPATFLIESEMPLPLEETFLPLAKRVLVKYVSTREVS
ncbi:MAG: hypothetical protein ACR2GN_05260 [Bacteroidia bacterium]